MSVTVSGAEYEWWRINGVDLDTLATRIEQAEGLYVGPSLRDTAVRVPHRRGEIPGPLIVDPGELVLHMWAKGVDPSTGTIPDGSTSLAEFDQVRSALARLLYAPTLTIEHGRADGGVRVATGRLTQGLGFGREISHPVFGRFAAAIRIHGGLWFDAEPVGEHFTLNSGTAAELWVFEGSEAPLDELEFVFGRTWNLTLTDPPTGDWLAYDGVVQTGEALRIDCAASRVYGDGGLIVDQGLIRRSGSSFFAVSPGYPPTVVVTHGSDLPVSMQVTGRRAYYTA